MELPLKIEIGGFTYTIEVNTAELENKMCLADSSQYFKRIRLKGDLSEEQLMDSLLHEILHCIDHIYLGEMLEEKGVTVLANGLHQALKQLGLNITYREVKDA